MADIPDGNYESAGFILAGTGKTDVLTVPAAGGLWYWVAMLQVNLGTGSPGTAVQVFWYDASEATEYVINDGASIAAGIPLELMGKPLLAMEANDIIRVKAAANYHGHLTFHRGSRNPENRG